MTTRVRIELMEDAAGKVVEVHSLGRVIALSKKGDQFEDYVHFANKIVVMEALADKDYVQEVYE